jgi:hypothetical protein
MRPGGVRRAPAGAQGFVLVGVVMMVLALTIIGVSLYSLSSYESQFFGRSRFERQALYAASGGVELVKVLVTTPLGSPPTARLSSASLAAGRVIGRDTLVSAVAWQDSPIDSTGPFNWSKEVHVRVRASVNGAARTVNASFIPHQPDLPYWRLFTAASPMTLVSSLQRLQASGGAWQPVQNASDSAWIGGLHAGSQISLTPTAPPVAAVSSYITDHYPAPSSADSAWISYNGVPPAYGIITLTMDAGSASASRFFRSRSDQWTVSQSYLPIFSYFTDANTHIFVRGTAVWILPKGIYSIGEFQVERLVAGEPANLVIVAGPNGVPVPNPLAGAWFAKGIWIPSNNVNVFVVSSGSVLISDASISLANIEARHLSVFGQSIVLSGPAVGTHTLRLEYAPDQKPVATDLYSRGLLPPISGMTMQALARIPGSWTSSPGMQ